MDPKDLEDIIKTLPPDYVNQEALFDINSDPITLDPETKEPKIDINKAVIQKTKVISRPPLTDEDLETISKEASMDKAKDDGSLDYVLNPLLASEIPGEGARLFYEDRAKREGVKPIRLHEDKELDEIIAFGPDETNPNYENALNEKGMRLRWAKNNDNWTNWRDPDYLKRNAERDLRALISGPLKLPSDLLYTTAVLASPQAQALKHMGFDTPAKIVDKVLEGGDYVNKKVNEILQTTDPQNPVEMAARLALPALMRVPLPGKIPGGIGGQVAEFITPLTVGGGKLRPVANFGAQFLGEELLHPFVAPAGDDYQTIFQSFFGSGAAEAETNNPELDKIVAHTPDGAPIKNSDGTTLGMFGLGMIAAAIAPGMIKYLYKKPLPVSKIIDASGRDAPKTLETIEKTSDQVRTYLGDPVTGQFAIMRRSGVSDQSVFNAIEDTTMANQRGRIKAASETGVMRTTDGDFTAPISPNRLRRAYEGFDKDKQAAAAEHAKLKDLKDTIIEAGKDRGAGLTLTEINKKIDDIEKVHPEVVKLHAGFRSINKALLDYMSTGLGALITKSKKVKLAKNRPNYARLEIEDVDPSLPLLSRLVKREQVSLDEQAGFFDDLPFLKRREVPSDGLPRVNPYDSLTRSVEQVLKAKLDNANRLRTIKALQKSPHGAKTVKEVSKETLENNPGWANRTHQVLDNGKVRHFVMSKLMHDVLHYDMNLPRNPYLFNTSRMFQFHTTGAGAPWFAPKQFLRTAWLQQITTPEGFKTLRLGSGGKGLLGKIGGIPGTEYITAAGGILSQERWRAQRGLANALYKASDSNSNILLTSIFDGMFKGEGKKAMRVLADIMAHSYLQSSYHAITSAGLNDISMSQNAIKNARGMMDEITRNKQLPSSVRAAGHAWSGLLDSIQNGANYAWAVRNSDKGWASAAKEAKRLSGDISISGKFYTKGGKAIGVDATNPVPGIGLLGRGVNTLREASPWTNSTIQSFRKLGLSYWENPVKFMMRLQVNFLMPAAAAYFYTAARGPKFTEYAYVQRGEYEKSTSMYIPNPMSDDPADGFEIPIPLEIAPLTYMFQNALDIFYRPYIAREAQNQGMLMDDQGGVDGSTIANTILENFFDLTVPPMVAGTAGAFGIKTGGTILFGEAPFESKDTAKGTPLRSYLPHNAEMSIRGFMGSAADVYVQSLNAYLSSDDVLTGIVAGLKEFGYQAKKKTPLASSKQLHSWTNISNESFELSGKLKDMNAITNRWITIDPVTGRPIVKLNPDIRKKEGKDIPVLYEQVEVETKGRLAEGNISPVGYDNPLSAVSVPAIGDSPAGFALLPSLTKDGREKTEGEIRGNYKKTGNFFGIFKTKEDALKYLTLIKEAEQKAKVIAPELERIPKTRMGLSEIPEPKNPIYIQLSQYIYERFAKDGDDYIKMVRRLSMIADQEKTIKNITTGNLTSWKTHIDELEKDDPVRQYLADMDFEDRDSVRLAINKLETDKAETLERVKLYVKESEDRINEEILNDPILSQKFTKPIKLMDLDPYEKP